MLASLHPGASGAEEPVDPPQVESEVLEEVIVTGSRILRKDSDSLNPLVSLDREDFEFSGQPTLEETLNQLPQMQPDFGRTSNDPGIGAAWLNLRGLGPGRSLILLNGRRLAPTYTGGAVDVNNLPQALIGRVEIITGGASTVYGSDAVAGVVNFMTRNDIDGFSLDTSYSVSARGDADVYDINLLYGYDLPDDRGNITAYAGHLRRHSLLASDRPYTRRLYFEDLDTGQLYEGGNYSTPAGVIFFPRVDLGQGPVNVTWDADGTPRAVVFEEDFYNFQAGNYLQVPHERNTVGVMATFDVGKRWETYLEAAFARNQSRLQWSPAGIFGQYVEVNIDNPLLTPETRQLFEEQLLVRPGVAGFVLGRRLGELGLRHIQLRSDNLRMVTGIRGEVGQDWTLDAWFGWTDTDDREELAGDGSLSGVRQGLLVDPATGNCVDPGNGCVPIDLFGSGRISAEAIEFLHLPPYRNSGGVRQLLASAVASGAPVTGWAGPIDMAFGAEARRDEGFAHADPALSSSDSLGYGNRSVLPIDGTETVWELYAEARAPLYSDSAGERFLDAELGARYSNYTHAGAVWAWKAGLEWRLAAPLRLRTMLQRSVRAPNLAELFKEQYSLNLFAAEAEVDPCSASNDPVGRGVAEKCLLQGLSTDQLGVYRAIPKYPFRVTQGGNPDLNPETSESLTAGMVVSPAPELTLSLDYYDIEVADAIGHISAWTICFDPLNADHVFCGNVQRDASGNVSHIYEPVSNRGLWTTRGVDTQFQYQRGLPAGLSLFGGVASIGLSAVWTHVLEWKTQENVVSSVLSCAGLFGGPCWGPNGGAFPEDRALAHLDYRSGGVQSRLTGRWIGSIRSGMPLTDEYRQHPNPQLAVPRLGSVLYVDLGFSIPVGESTQVQLGVNNLADKTPPFIPGFRNNTAHGLYDVFGRSYYLSLTWNPRQ